MIRSPPARALTRLALFMHARSLQIPMWGPAARPAPKKRVRAGPRSREGRRMGRSLTHPAQINQGLTRPGPARAPGEQAAGPHRIPRFAADHVICWRLNPCADSTRPVTCPPQVKHLPGRAVTWPAPPPVGPFARPGRFRHRRAALEDSSLDKSNVRPRATAYPAGPDATPPDGLRGRLSMTNSHGSHPALAPAVRKRRGSYKSRRRPAYAQQLVTTRLLDCVHDRAARLSRLQRIYPRAL
jgi:hypothetical protein